jgi:hypothetical protein
MLPLSPLRPSGPSELLIMLEDFDLLRDVSSGIHLHGPKVCVPSFQGVTHYISACGGLLAKGLGGLG